MIKQHLSKNESQSNKLNIILLDDDKVQRYAVRRQLACNQFNFDVFEAECGDEALQILRTNRIHCIIVDYILPDYDGLTFIEHVTQKFGACPPFLFITSFGTGEVVRRAFKSGCYDYISKEKVHSEELLQALIELTEYAQHHNDFSSKVENIELLAAEVTHDLNSPMRSMSYSVNQILAAQNFHVSEPILKHVTNLKNNLKNMWNILLDINYGLASKGEKFKLDDVNLNDIVHEIIESVTHAYPEKSINFSVKKLPVLWADRSGLYRILYNIISNGIKYNKQDTVCIHISYNKTSLYNEIIIKDNGIGMHISHLNNIFKPFYRTNSYEHITGNGLGLTICRRIIEQHNGKIFVDSTLEEGSCFKIALPRQRMHI